jgi:hypothetical protein
MINFPQNPAAGQVYTFGAKSWKWNGRAWDLQTITDTMLQRVESIVADLTGPYAKLTELTNYELLRNVGHYANLVVNGNWSPAWQAAHDYVEQLVTGGTVVFPPNFSARFDTPIKWNPNKVGVEGNGAFVDFGYVAGNDVYCITLRQTVNDANLRQAKNRQHPWTGTMFSGSYGNTRLTCLKVADNDPFQVNGVTEYHAAGITMRDVQFMNFWRDVEVANGGFFLNLKNCTFAIQGLAAGGSYDTALYIPNGSINAGENINLDGCMMIKVYGTLIRCDMPSASILAKGCSADYTAVLFDIRAGSLNWDGYIENSTDTDCWIQARGTNTVVDIRGPILVTGSKVAKEIFYSDATATNGGIKADINLQFGGGLTYEPLKLVAGTGRAVVTFAGHSNSTTHPAIGGSTNLLANGSFEGAALSDWNLSGANLPVISADFARSGTKSMKFPAAPGYSPAASKTVPAKPGQFLTGELYYKVVGITGTNGHFYVAVDWLDSGGISIGGGALVDATVDVAAWTRTRIGFLDAAPKGTASVRLSISIFNVASGTPAGYIDDVELAVA